MRILCKAVVLACCIFLFAGCSPEVGSDAWCKKIKEKPKGDWTANEASDFTRHCILKLEKE
ncbi:MAG TPA: DUF3012 domain-containing protein [Nitrospirae bacterium]|nr:hypothetical protein BMS3Abin10_01225 [bacterium BMS3Abin10]GBE38443.1 hypothetical protein BMS3Bbin08_01049 [bacterium BMS3Bbin08]HDH50562.1 DUF3012 domain-containing protein [Nitrospirota bacterium]HDK16498.1 DUF3012 domain-containing protein [Nitrospirota bacterium]HDO25166.1 DUF3012 domain-containing protein [Nitrospirota bacterium]